MTRKEAAIGVAGLLSSPDRWTQGADARDSGGYPVPAGSPRAVCWCLVGAVRKVTGVYMHSLLDALTDQIPETPQTLWVSDFNDRPTTTFPDIRRLLESCQQ